MTPPTQFNLQTAEFVELENQDNVRIDESHGDLVEDLSELQYLIDDLDNSEMNEDDDDQRWLFTNFTQTIGSLKSRARRNQDSLQRSSDSKNAFQALQLRTKVSLETASIKSALRPAFRQRGVLQCGQDWQSPIYAASIPYGVNRMSDGIAEHAWDYKRDGHLDAVVYEKQFVEEYATHLGASRLQAYLTNSGMAAFSTVMHTLCDELSYGSSVLALQPMYFENLHVGRAFVPKMVQCNPRSSAELLAVLRAEEPSIVLCDVISNCGNVVEHDVETVLRWARTEARSETFIVVDATCMPAALLRADLLSCLPKNVSVIIIESLAKHHQFGMDTVTGGIIIADLAQPNHDALRKTRARLGTNIADTSVGSLPRPDHERLTARMNRHSRNVKLFAETMETSMTSDARIIESLSWLRESTALPGFAGSCLTISLGRKFRSLQCYREFEAKVLELAKRRNHPIVFGTSFGFDVTRLYLTAPSTRFEEPFLRVAIGTETADQIATLADIICQSDEELFNEWSAKPVAKTNERKAIAERAQEYFAVGPESEANDAALHTTKPGLQESVFTGENAIKNYLCPANYPAAPLVELPADLNPFRKDGVRIMAKMMPLVPLMNIKSIPAYSMLNEAASRGELDGVQNVIESSSSNTVLSLSVVSRLFGINNTHAIVDHSIAPSLMRMLRLFGIEILLHPAAGHELFGKLQPRSERATTMGSKAGWFNPGQYSNPDNPEGFARWMAPDLWDQCNGRLDILSCGLGTCGTMYGIATALRQRNAALEVVACCPAAGEAVPGPREQSLLGDVTFAWQGLADSEIKLSAHESFSASVDLLRRGILGGPSSGMNYAGLLRHLEAKRNAGELASMADAKGEIWCVFVCCDSPLPHVDEYYDALGDDFFPAIHPVPTHDEFISKH